MHPFLYRIHQHSPVDVSLPVVVGFSGGPDSECLLAYILAVCPDDQVTVVYVDHQLRDDQSCEHARLAQLKARLNVRVCRIDVDPNRIETSAREGRYAQLIDVANDVGTTQIVVGHHQDDHIETILMQLVRGSKQLTGILPVRDRDGVRIMRPLLGVTKEEIVTYLRDVGQSYCEDVTNESMAFTRNKIRHQLVPLLQQLNPNVGQSLIQLSSYHQAMSAYLDQYCSETIDAKALASQPAVVQSHVLHRFLSVSTSGTLAERHVAMIQANLGATESKEWHLPGLIVSLRRGLLTVQKR